MHFYLQGRIITKNILFLYEIHSNVFQLYLVKYIDRLRSIAIILAVSAVYHGIEPELGQMNNLLAQNQDNMSDQI
jgi:hypothetical protein